MNPEESDQPPTAIFRADIAGVGRVACEGDVFVYPSDSGGVVIRVDGQADGGLIEITAAARADRRAAICSLGDARAERRVAR